MEGRKWEDIEMDCLVNVLGRVGMESLLLDIPFVCKSWYKASLSPSCWSRIVFPHIRFGLNDSFSKRLMNVYGIEKFSILAFIKFIVNRSCKNATTLILPSACAGEIEALKYVADECTALKILGLRCDFFCYKQEQIISELIGKWKNLVGLALGSCCNLKEILAQISFHCKNFKGLRVENAKIGKEEASAIVTLLPNIKKLLLRGASIDGENLMIILQGCKELVLLDVRDCLSFEADDKILELASHILTFKYERTRPPDSFLTVDQVLYVYDDDYEGRLYDDDDDCGGILYDYVNDDYSLIFLESILEDIFI